MKKNSKSKNSTEKIIGRVREQDLLKDLISSKKSEFIATDGGSNQEEAYYIGKPCIILRNVTERIEGLGENAVLSKGDEKIILKFINNYHKYERGRVKISVNPSRIIIDYLISH